MRSTVTPKDHKEYDDAPEHYSDASLTILNSAMEGLGIAIGDYLLDPFKDVVDVITLVVGSITEFISIPIGVKMKQDQEAMMGLFTALERGNLPLEQRKRLTEELNSEYGDYLPNLIT